MGVWIGEQIARMGPFDLVYNGRGGIPGCSWTIRKGEETDFSLYDLADRLCVRGWQVPAYPMPAHRRDLVVQRVVARLGLSRDLAELLVEDRRRAIQHFEENPSPKSLTREDAGGYYHN